MNYEIVTYKGKLYIQVPKLKELGLKHCFTTNDTDMGIKTNKSIDDISNSLNNIYDFMDIKPEVIYSGFQTHSTNIAIVEEKELGNSYELGRYIPKTDGLVTSNRNIALVTRFADCIPIAIFDSVNKVHANIHSGWKGTLNGIVSKGIEIMKKNYASKSENLHIVLGPSIGQMDFEVDQDVMEMFEARFSHLEEAIKRKNENKYLINLKEINRMLILKEEVREENIIDINLSTYSTPFLHSYRRDKEDFGLMAFVTSL